MFTYKTQGTCSKNIHVDLENGKIISVRFEGGCAGNSLGIGRLVAGMTVADAISKLKGIRCGSRPTSCPDQLARALESHRAGR